MYPKRILIGLLGLALFGLFLVQVGKIDLVVGVARDVLPTIEPSAQEPVDNESIINPFRGSGLVDQENILVANRVVVMLDSIPGTDSADNTPDYKRDEFGPRWSDIDHNGCDTRNDILQRDLTDVTFKLGTHDCVVITGLLDDNFTGQQIEFVKTRAGEVQIDHMVPLSWAWQNGATEWSADKRQQFANDPLNLSAVSGSANASKGDRGPASWRPENASYRCEYVAHFVLVVKTYDLTIGDRDRQSARRQLAGCN